MASKDLYKSTPQDKDDTMNRVADEGVVASNRITKKGDKSGIPNLKEINDEDIPEYIEILDNHRKMCEKNGNYVEAEMAKNRIHELRTQYDSRRRDDLKVKHGSEKDQIEEAHLAEFNQFNEFWDKKMIEFTEQAQIIEEQMINKHQQEMAKFMEELDASLPPRPKDSVELLNLRKIQESLARQKDYIEAHKIQQKCIQLEKDELEKWQHMRDLKIKNQKNQLEQKQSNELAALRKRIITGQDEQRKARSIELERLLQKYQNVKKELDAQQQLELLRHGKPGAKQAAGSLFKSQGSRYVGAVSDSGKTPRIDKKIPTYDGNPAMRKSGVGYNKK